MPHSQWINKDDHRLRPCARHRSKRALELIWGCHSLSLELHAKRLDGNDDIDLAPDQVSGQIAEMLAPTFCPSLLDGEVLSFDIAELVHPGTKRVNKVAAGGRTFSPKEPYTPTFCPPVVLRRRADGQASRSRPR
jgi:hypothetical protein